MDIKTNRWLLKEVEEYSTVFDTWHEYDITPEEEYMGRFLGYKGYNHYYDLPLLGKLSTDIFCGGNISILTFCQYHTDCLHHKVIIRLSERMNFTLEYYLDTIPQHFIIPVINGYAEHTRTHDGIGCLGFANAKKLFLKAMRY